MTLDEKVGQLFVPEISNDDSLTQSNIKKYHLGGVLLMGNNFVGNRQTFINRIKGFQKSAEIPLTISTDQEGGTVSRLDAEQTHRSYYPSPQEANDNGGLRNVTKDYQAVAKEMHELGFNWNFAPIADVAKGPNDYIYARTFGQGYTEAGSFVSQAVVAMQKEKVAASLKHFPGYGAAKNTHTGSAEVNKSVAKFKKEDFLPFQAGINAGADSVMVTHIIMNKVDPGVPASLSKKDIDLLRDGLSYDGVIVSDSLQMGAVVNYVNKTGVSRDVKAFQAGNDVLLSDDFQQGIPEIKKAVKDGKISNKRLNDSVVRILTMKHKVGLKVF
ncbi:glycoside hydrolase family 3 N-terminal domain-containing protein [Pediococcus argentinicus]|uniref:glycoside hydrolase family 3 protein n=1 Tax=Pediococcus argentinicus TaxID=480391 RepID=UPI00338DACCE